MSINWGRHLSDRQTQNSMTLEKIKKFGMNGGAATLAILLSPIAAFADTVDNVIASSSDGIEGVLGFGIGDGVSWMVTNLLVPFIGAGLAVLYNLRWPIVAVIALSIVVYFAFRAFGFFRH